MVRGAQVVGGGEMIIWLGWDVDTVVSLCVVSLDYEWLGAAVVFDVCVLFLVSCMSFVFSVFECKQKQYVVAILVIWEGANQFI